MMFEILELHPVTGPNKKKPPKISAKQKIAGGNSKIFDIFIPKIGEDSHPF